MHAIRVLLDSTLDYAGLFPPAQLDMRSTIRMYSAALSSKDRWMLSRLIIPVSRFSEFVEFADPYLPRVGEPGGVEPWVLSVLVAPAADRQIVADLERIENFNLRMEDREFSQVYVRAVIDTIETKAATPNEIDRALEYVPDEIFAYFEMPVDSDPRGMIATMASLDAGAKIRTGGMNAAAHPEPAQVARFLKACRMAEVPFKATAGLHHALRHDAKDVGCKQFGFLNVFVAGVLLWEHEDMSEQEIQALLVEERADAFDVSPTGITWKERSIRHDRIAVARERFAHSVGSCSFDEPLADLRALGLLSSSSEVQS